MIDILTLFYYISHKILCGPIGVYRVEFMSVQTFFKWLWCSYLLPYSLMNILLASFLYTFFSSLDSLYIIIKFRKPISFIILELYKKYHNLLVLYNILTLWICSYRLTHLCCYVCYSLYVLNTVICTSYIVYYSKCSFCFWLSICCHGAVRREIYIGFVTTLLPSFSDGFKNPYLRRTSS